ncbi:uncharacterized protein TNCV_2173231 [Trichonephila clavipes]|nr:uncharacterized protein TNCV_2173231 [Trichonephila clavipes]
MMRHYMRDRGLVMGRVGRIRENSKDLRKPRGSEHGDQKRPTPVPPQGIKRTVPSSISSRNHKYRRPNNPSQGPQSISGPSHQLDTRQCKPPTEESRQGARGQQATAVRPYLRSRLKKPEGIPEEQWDRPQNHLRRRSLSMEALDGYSVG